MMVIEENGRTQEEAVITGLRKLGIPREYVLVEPLAPGARGFLGFGGQQARVRLNVTPAGERLIQGRGILEKILTLMGVQTQVHVEERLGVVHLELSGEHAGLLIGRHGQTLEALELVVGRILDREAGERTPVALDVEGYRERRHQQLEQMALGLAKQAKKTGEAVVLEPMAPADRRIIHLLLKGDEGVRTASVGDGRLRRLTITPVAPSGPA